MSDHERGAYTPPTDAPLSFDAREPVRGTRPAPLTLIISILVLVGLAAAIFVFYRSGVRQAGQPPQTVGEPVGPVKAPPPAEAQPQDPAAGLQIYKSEGGASASARPSFTPPPEQPQPRSQPAPVVVTPPPAPTPASPAPALRPALPPAPPAAAAATPPPAPPKAAAPAPAPLPVQKAPAAPPKPRPEPAAAKSPPAGGAGGAVVQIGAVSSTALADKAWSDAVAVAPGLAAGKGKGVEKIEKNGGTLYRTAVTGFADREAATAFCNKLKAAGKSCFVR